MPLPTDMVERAVRRIGVTERAKADIVGEEMLLNVGKENQEMAN